MQLCLVNNDPISTLFVTSDGDPLFSIETPSLPHSSVDESALPQKYATTTIKRLQRYHTSTGHVVTEVGIVDYRGPTAGSHLQLCVENHNLDIPPRRETRAITENLEDVQVDSWEFTGSDSRRYKWQMVVHSPILFLADDSLTLLARYHHAKLGIVSRSRRAFLEILPAGIALIDLIVATFVAFVKQRFLIDGNDVNSEMPALSAAPLAATELPCSSGTQI
ncbi:hypothetical protein BDZ97DRAFT_1669364 [Flammula alnicola]|nr:hypothetical protein BDZ97DRAFT_1669364 [Flammula alnicola]